MPHRLRHYERLAEWPLLVIALLWLVCYSWPILDPGLPAPWATAMRWTNAVIWGAFVVDYLTRIWLSADRWQFVRKNLVLLLVLAVPACRPLHALRVVTLMSMMRRNAGAALRGRVVMYSVVFAVLLWFISAVSVLQAERYAAGANILTGREALWWSLTTMTTVGYGDYFPVTVPGQLFAAVLIIGGVALMGAVTATISSRLIAEARGD